MNSEPIEDDTKYWEHHDEKELFRDRVEIDPKFILESNNYIDGNIVGPRLEYIKRWSPERWYLSLYGMLHIIPQNDFRYLEESIKSKTPRTSKIKKSGHKYFFIMEKKNFDFFSETIF